MRGHLPNSASSNVGPDKLMFFGAVRAGTASIADFSVAEFVRIQDAVVYRLKIEFFKSLTTSATGTVTSRGCGMLSSCLRVAWKAFDRVFDHGRKRLERRGSDQAATECEHSRRESIA